MKKELVTKLKNTFDGISHTDEYGVEYWNARELSQLLQYTEFNKFIPVIKKAIVACETNGFDPNDHFAKIQDSINIGSGAQREFPGYNLTRYACYLIAMNGDPRKDEIAFAQSYFAVQTRKQELIEQQMELRHRLQLRDQLKESEKRLSQNIYERGVDDRGFGRIRSKGDQALFGGYTTQDMKDKYGVTSGPLADHLPAVTIAAKNLATEMTNLNVEGKDLTGEYKITEEHVQNNRSVRGMLKDRGIEPENLPPAEDLKKLERRVTSEEKKLAKETTAPKLNKKNDE